MTFEDHGIGLPDRFRVEEGAGGLRILWRLPRLIGVIVGAFAVIWDTFLVFFITRITDDGTPRVFLLFISLHVAAGILLPYLALVFFFNSSVLEVGQGMLRLRQCPLPWLGNRTLRTTEIAQLFSTRVEASRGRVTYNVMARLTSGREISLVKQLWEERQARFLEQTIERRLGIPDKPVVGELPR